MNVVVIGAGPDELVVARLLARSGRAVTLIEEHATPQLLPAVLLAPIAAELGADARVTPLDPWLRTALPDGSVLELSRDMAKNAEALRRVSPADAARWPQFCERVARVARLLERFYTQPAPSMVDARFALRVRLLGRQGMEDFMRWLPMPLAELLDEWFECDALKGALAALALRHVRQGPRSAGTAFLLLHANVGNPAGVFRAPGLAIAGDFAGVHRRQAKVSRIEVRGGAVATVVLAGGEELPASLVVSGADPRRTLVDLVPPGWLDPELVRALRNLRSRGTAALGTAALATAALRERGAPVTLTVAPSLDAVERAYDATKYGELSPAPIIDMAGDGTSLHVHLQYVPYAVDDDTRRRLRETLQTVVAPSIAQEMSLHAPADLEALYGWPQGQAQHAELALDQALWMRPVPELAGYETPIRGLWLCGPAMHPGPLIAGAAGYNCARRILSTLGA